MLSACAHRSQTPTTPGPAPGPTQAQQTSGSRPLADVHFHLRNYIQQGITLKQAHALLKRRGVHRASVFGIPLQQRWDMETGVAPGYYLHDDQALYYYSAIDGMVAAEYQALSKAQRAMFDPMIVGFNPTDGRGVDHIRHMLLSFPGTFSGIGEFSIKKEVVSSKIAGGAANIEDPALGRILDFAAETGLVVLLHCDVDAMISADKEQPTYLKALQELFQRHRDAKIIWAHTGLGRYVRARPQHTQWLGSLLSQNPNLWVDISWDVVAEQFFDSQGKLLAPWKKWMTEHSRRILFGSDAVAPTDAQYQKVLALYDKIWRELPPAVVERITYGNYIQLFDQARLQVRRWEKKEKGNG